MQGIVARLYIQNSDVFVLNINKYKIYHPLCSIMHREKHVIPRNIRGIIPRRTFSHNNFFSIFFYTKVHISYHSPGTTASTLQVYVSLKRHMNEVGPLVEVVVPL